MPPTLRPLGPFLFTLLLLLAGCGPEVPAVTSAPEQAQNNGWPRTLKAEHGAFTLQKPPLRIASTSITLTGALLAIDAPVVASGATSRNSPVSDDNGFFSQWGPIAKQRGVLPLYHVEPNAEAVAAVNPDLIIVSATSGDSALKIYAQLSAIAPTLVLNHDDKSWQQITTQLGYITGHEIEAERAIHRFEQRVAEVKRRITLPPQPVTAFVYVQSGLGANVFTADSAQGRLLAELGFTLATPPAEVRGNNSMGLRKDIILLSGEKLAEGLNGETLLLFVANDDKIADVAANPFLQHLPPVVGKRIYAMGEDSFRLDYYSANNLLSRLEQQFAP